jgi:hypothetical protein
MEGTSGTTAGQQTRGIVALLVVSMDLGAFPLFDAK